MTQPIDSTSTCDPPFARDLQGFYSFLVEVDVAWKGSLSDVRTPTPKLIEELLNVARPEEPLVHPGELRLPLFILNTLRRIDEKPPLQFNRGIGRVRQQKFRSVIIDDLDNPSELARTIRLQEVLSRHEHDALKLYADLLELEIAAFDHSIFSEDHLKRLFPGTALLAIGAAAAWSGFAGHFLGLDLLSSAWTHIGRLGSAPLGTWSKALLWGVFGVGLLYIAGWAAIRNGNLKQKGRLLRVKRHLKLHLATSAHLTSAA